MRIKELETKLGEHGRETVKRVSKGVRRAAATITTKVGNAAKATGRYVGEGARDSVRNLIAGTFTIWSLHNSAKELLHATDTDREEIKKSTENFLEHLAATTVLTVPKNDRSPSHTVVRTTRRLIEFSRKFS